MRQTTIRFADGIYQRLERASTETGLPINAIVTVACMAWLDDHPPTIGAEKSGQARETGWLGRLLWGRRRAFDRFAPDARDALARAEEEARGLGHAFVGTEHLLLGLLAGAQTPATQALAELGVDYQGARREVERIVGRGTEPVDKEIGLTGRAKAAIERAVAEANRQRTEFVGTEHLLLGLVGDAKGVGAGALAALGVEPGALRAALDRRG